MTEQVLIAIIVCVQTIGTALIGIVVAWINRVRKDIGRVKTDAEAARINSAAANKNSAAANVNSAAARSQVENDHSTNLRVENDSRHAETKGWFDGLRNDVTAEFRAVRSDIGAIRQEMLTDRQAHQQTQRVNNDTHESIVDRLTNLEQKETS